jgi:hypothetical protein
MAEEITSYREIREILDHPDTARLKMNGILPLMDQRYRYFRLGKGCLIYFLQGTVAHMHGAALRGDTKGRKALEAVWDHWKALAAMGIKKVITRHDKDHIRAAIMCRALGMQKTDDAAKNTFEVAI